MTWENFYLFCFLVGFLWSLLSLVIGHLNIDLPFHHDGIHLGDGGGHDVAGMNHGDFSHGDVSHGDVSHAGGDAHNGASHQLHTVSVSPLNFGTIAAFLAWFGGAGFLLSRYSPIWFVWGLLLSIAVGVAGASVVFWFLARVLVGHERNLNPADYSMTGVLGRVSSSIREKGTGEIIYSQEGTRRTCGARSEDGRPIPAGTEILVTRYQKGIAYVRRWDEFSKAE